MNTSDTRRWSDVLNKGKRLAFHVEASTRCNSRCPFCPRFLTNTPFLDPSVPQHEITIDEFKRWFPKEVLDNTFHFNFCGNYGDPSACTDFVEIIKYIKENSNCQINVHSNGGARSEEFWSELGSLLQTDTRFMIFSVDGLEDTNHLYRVGVKWERLEKNMKAFIAAGGHAILDFLIFKHNEHQIEDVRKYFSDLGFKSIQQKRALGMENDVSKEYYKRPVINKEGVITHHLETAQMYRRPEYKDTKWSESDEQLSEYVKKLKDPKNRITPKNKKTADQVFEYNKSIENIPVKCHAFAGWDSRELFLNPNGDLLPCCFLGQLITPNTPSEDIQLRSDLGEYSQFNLDHNSLDNIIKLWDQKVADKWNKSFKEGRSVTCSKTCGQRDYASLAYDDLYQEFTDLESKEKKAI